MKEALLDITIQKLIEYNQEDEHLLIQKQDQLKRLTDYINSNPTEDDINELNNLKTSLEQEIQDLQNNKKDTYKFNDNDLIKMLETSKQIIGNLYGTDFINENDTNPSIRFDNTGRNKLGFCRTQSSRYNNQIISSEIIISKILQKFSEDQLMNTVIHEYIHSLKCCTHCGHYGKWKEIADRINSSTDYDINIKADDEQANMFDDILDSNHKTVYHIICNNCGSEQKFYTANADIVKHPDHYKHRCSNGETGTFTLNVEKR